MRFQRLQLRPYGAFEHLDLDFSEARGGAGMHLVYGPNGAGKSTTLDALRSALFGINFRGDERKDFLFDSSTLRIGAHLVRGAGDEIRFVRRTSTKAPLWDETDEAPIEVERLAPFLGGLDRERFETLFGLDLATMVSGGRDLLKGEGEIGRALFAAGLGGQRLGQTFDRLDEAARALWVDRSPNSSIARLLKDHDRLSKDLRGASKSASLYATERKELKRLRDGAENERRARREARARVEQLERLARAATLLEPLEAKSREREALGTEPALDAEIAERALALDAEREELAREAAARKERVRGAEARRIELRATADAALVAAAADVDALSARRGSFQDALAEIAAATAALAEATAARGEAARRAGLDVGAAGAGPGSTTDASLDALSAAVDRHHAALQRTGLERTRCLREQKLAEAAQRRASERAAAFGERAPAEFERDLEALRPFAGTIEELESLRPPTESEVAASIESWDALDARSEALRRRAEELDAAERAARETLARLDDDPREAPPTADELDAARAERDTRVRDALDRAVSGDRLERGTALEVERAVSAADEVADRRTAQARRAEERAGFIRRLGEIAAQQEAAAREAETCAAEREAARTRWREAVGDVRLAHLAPREFAAWIQRRRALLDRVAEARGRVEGEVAAARAALGDRSAELAAVEQEATEAESAWRSWSQEHGLAPDGGPEATRQRLRGLVEARSYTREMVKARERLDDRRAAVQAFVHDVATLVERLRIPVDESRVAGALGSEGGLHALTEARMRALIDASEAAKRADAEMAALDRQLGSERDAASLAKAQADEVERALDDLGAKAAVESRQGLMARARVAERVRAVEAELRDLDSRFSAAAEGRTGGEVREQLEGRELGDLESEASELRAKIEALDAATGARAKEIWELEASVEGTGSREAAALESELAALEAQLNEDLEDYLRVRVSKALLQREVDRYRQETQGPLLERAQSLLRVLTLGAYEKLHPSESRGQAVMVARRPDGRTVHVEGMSTGTRDQLYLALRIASVEHMLETVEPMPFIADDLFVNFDDERTEAALRVLAELSRSTQVIVFTHHLSVVDTARRLSDGDVPVHVIELGQEAAREAAR